MKNEKKVTKQKLFDELERRFGFNNDLNYSDIADVVFTLNGWEDRSEGIPNWLKFSNNEPRYLFRVSKGVYRLKNEVNSCVIFIDSKGEYFKGYGNYIKGTYAEEIITTPNLNEAMVYSNPWEADSAVHHINSDRAILKREGIEYNFDKLKIEEL